MRVGSPSVRASAAPTLARGSRAQLDDEVPERAAAAVDLGDADKDRHRDDERGRRVDPVERRVQARPAFERGDSQDGEVGRGERARGREREQRCARSRRCPVQAPQYERDEGHTERDEHAREYLSERRDVEPCADEEQGRNARAAVSAAAGIREEKRECHPEQADGVGDRDERTLQAIAHPPARVGEDHLRIDGRLHRDRKPPNGGRDTRVRPDQAEVGQDADGHPDEDERGDPSSLRPATDSESRSDGDAGCAGEKGQLGVRLAELELAHHVDDEQRCDERSQAEDNRGSR